MVNPKGNQPWIFIGRTDAEAEAPPDTKSWLTGKTPDAGQDWGQEEKGTTEDEMVGWHHRLKGQESEQTPGLGDGQGSLACCSSRGHKESDMTKRVSNSNNCAGHCLGDHFGSFHSKKQPCDKRTWRWDRVPSQDEQDAGGDSGGEVLCTAKRAAGRARWSPLCGPAHVPGPPAVCPGAKRCHRAVVPGFPSSLPGHCWCGGPLLLTSQVLLSPPSLPSVHGIHNHGRFTTLSTSQEFRSPSLVNHQHRVG